MIEVPIEARRWLENVQRVAPSAVIAGGFLRDLHAGVQPKDIDIFVPAPFGMVWLPEPMRSECRTVYRTGEGYNGGMRDEVIWVGEIPTSYLPLNIVVLMTPNPDMTREEFAAFVRERVDFDFCQITFDGSRLSLTTACSAALRTKTATCVLPPDDPDRRRSWRRAERWKTRFRGWRFRFPDPEVEALGL